MDAWSSEQLKKMQLGGNDALNNFLKKYGVDKHTDIKEKYNSPAAEVISLLPSRPSCSCRHIWQCCYDNYMVAEQACHQMLQ